MTKCIRFTRPGDPQLWNTEWNTWSGFSPLRTLSENVFQVQFSEPRCSIYATQLNTSAEAKHHWGTDRVRPVSLIHCKTDSRVDGDFGSDGKVYPTLLTRWSPFLGQCGKGTIWVLRTEHIEWSCRGLKAKSDYVQNRCFEKNEF